jgi:anti-anti-sigma regulatory factor
VTIDCAAAKRIDFVNAGRLLNVLEKQKAEGKEIVVRGAGEMIIALFAVMGITKIARIIPRK